MARKDATQRAQARADEPQHGDVQKDDSKAIQQSQRGMRRRRPQQQRPAAAAAAEEATFVDPVDSMPWYRYYPMQYGGLTLGVLACSGTALGYNQDDPLSTHKMMGWLAVALVGLTIHELRPFKRMSYGDKAREAGVGFGF